MSQTVLVAGATGMLASCIAHHLPTQPGATVRLFVRPRASENPIKTLVLAPLLAGGAEILQGDLADQAAALSDLQNGRYPDIHPRSFAQFLQRALVPAEWSRA